MDKEQFDDLCFKQFTEAQEGATKQIPDGIIRAYRKTIHAQNLLPFIEGDGSGSAYHWMEEVRWELAQLYPDLNKLPKEE